MTGSGLLNTEKHMLRILYDCSEYQATELLRMPYMVPLDLLPDGDILIQCIESGMAYPHGVYILTREGQVHSPDWHYTHFHGYKLLVAPLSQL